MYMYICGTKAIVPQHFKKIRTMNNLFFDRVLDNKNGMYIHALGVSDTYEIEICIKTIYLELFYDVAIEIGEKKAKKQLIEFFQTMELHAMVEENEEEIFNFDFKDFIGQLD